MKLTKEQLLKEINEAYAKTGLKPQLGDYFSEDNSCACPVGVLHCAANFKQRSCWFLPSVARNTFARKYDTDTEWVHDFIHGVDGTGNSNGFRRDNEGFKYGEYVRNKLFAETRSATSILDSSSSDGKL